MAIRDLLAEENADAAAAMDAAVQGGSLGGMRSSDPSGGPLYGDRITPLIEQARGFVERHEIAEADAKAFTGQVAAPMARMVVDAKERKPFGSQEQTLAYPKRPGFRRYWFNDDPGRIMRAHEAGYAHVMDPKTGQPVQRITGVTDGRGRSSFLMEIPIQWYQEDMQRQAAELSARLNEIRQGKADPSGSGNQYVPQQGIKIQGR